LAGREQLVHGAVAFPGPRDQAALAAADVTLVAGCACAGWGTAAAAPVPSSWFPGCLRQARCATTVFSACSVR
jgi:hypothetical protein